MEDNNNDRKMFLVILSIATLITTILGATFAYFSAQTNSADNAVGAGAADAPYILFTGETRELRTNLIPATENIAIYAAFVDVQHDENYCVDDNGNEVCSIYSFNLLNESNIAETIYITLTTTYLNKFTNLTYRVYAGSPSTLRSTYTTSQSIFNSPDYIMGHHIPDVGNSETFVYGKVLGAYRSGSEEQAYTIIIWLDETGTNQNAEAGGSWSGTINVTTGTGTGVTGVIDFNRLAPSSSSPSSSSNVNANKP